MQLFKLKTRLSEFDSFADFAKEFNLTKEDLIITNEFLYNPYIVVSSCKNNTEWESRPTR